MTSNRTDWLIAIGVLGLTVFVIAVVILFWWPLIHYAHLYWVN